MAGLYFHIPYCYRACSYCNFHFSTSLKTKPLLLEAMKKEMRLRSSTWNKKITSIYFGGGTPSILEASEFSDLVKEIKRDFDLSELDEFTLECNPEDLTDEKLSTWKKCGVNRLSIGNQSFQDEILKKINRQHTSEEAKEGVKRARKYSFDSISMDVILGLPGLTNSLLEEDLEKLLKLNPEHISAYQLSIEEKTKLAHQLKKGWISIPSEEDINKQFILTHDFLVKNGYAHYEVSNYAKNGYRAKHNSSYWSGEEYLGIGPGAHSFNGEERRWNISNNNTYIKEINSDGAWFETEELTEKDRFNERIMTSLRIKSGLDIKALREDYPNLFTKEIDEKVELWVQNKWATFEVGKVQLTMEGWLISDSLASDIFVL